MVVEITFYLLDCLLRVFASTFEHYQTCILTSEEGLCKGLVVREQDGHRRGCGDES